MKIKNTHLLVGDFFIIAFVVILSALVFILMLPKEFSQNKVEVFLDNKLIYSAKLKDGVLDTVEVDGKVHNTVEIDGTRVRVTHSTCYDHVCENVGYISKSGEVIVCMPNKVLVQIKGEKKHDSVDVVVK